ncbi:molybdenum cofactor guanylyltransferase [Marinomonas posidonica]|uniref:Molybdenum cofactor guanylyltransferase n=1 Tax=Marinomonas posidonica (strain CECT 7376 / NCIMB 14433 / IVIA-Po-181) TaxID=491952 RepID=F6CW05_MARPP|nr:molybdenum cofactor guanylyltransferase [Marinomonas posidonica]AEF54304.1 Molybdopterin-guanine dinucleotide biosynthesis protein A [Marinomonas posidonica IVIA-Po-181]
MEITSITGAVLAGGKGERVSGQDKGLLSFRDEPMAVHVIRALQPSVDRILINANRHLVEYQEMGYELHSDAESVCDKGPLAGLYSCLAVSKSSHLMVSPCDTPLITASVFESLLEAASASPDKIHYLQDDKGRHPLHAIMPVASSLFALDVFLSQQDKLAVMAFYESFGCQSVHIDSGETLRNFNTWADLQAFE